MKNHLLTTCLAAGLSLPIAGGLAAYMPQDSPTVTNGIEAVCTGVGSAKTDPRWPSYPVRAEFSNQGGQYVAGEHISLDKDGRQITTIDCDAPWVLFKLPAGNYSLTATLPSEPDTRAHTVTFATGNSGRQKALEITFPRLPPNQ